MGGLAVSGITVVFFVIIGIIVIVQLLITSRLIARNRLWAALGVWMVYPAAIIPFFGYTTYVGYRVELAAREYASRELPTTVGVVRNILYMNPEKYWGDFDMSKTCDRACLTILKDDVLESIAIVDHIQFKVYRLESAETCNKAHQLGRAIDVEQSGKLTSLGYFNECLTSEFVGDYDYDIRIDFGGRAMKRPYGPCCAIAEIHERGDEEPRFVARWEGRYHTDSSFNVTTIIKVLTGRSFESHLKQRLAGSVGEELALLEGRHLQGAYVAAWPYTSEWITRVFRQQMKAEGVQKIGLSDQDIDTLLRIAPNRQQETFESHFRNYERYVDEQSLERLKEAEANRLSNG